MLVIQYGPLAWPVYSGGSFPLQTPSSGAGFSVLHDANFRSFLSSSIAQQIGHRMGLFVLSWLILEKTDSPLQLGLVLVFHTLPTPITAMLGGLIADRFNRLGVIQLTQVANALVVGGLLALIALDVVSPWQIFVVSFLQGVVRGGGVALQARWCPRHCWRKPSGGGNIPGANDLHHRQSARPYSGRHLDPHFPDQLEWQYR